MGRCDGGGTGPRHCKRAYRGRQAAPATPVSCPVLSVCVGFCPVDVGLCHRFCSPCHFHARGVAVRSVLSAACQSGRTSPQLGNARGCHSEPPDVSGGEESTHEHRHGPGYAKNPRPPSGRSLRLCPRQVVSSFHAVAVPSAFSLVAWSFSAFICVHLRLKSSPSAVVVSWTLDLGPWTLPFDHSPTVVSYLTPCGTGTGCTTVMPWSPAVRVRESTATNAVYALISP